MHSPFVVVVTAVIEEASYGLVVLRRRLHLQGQHGGDFLTIAELNRSIGGINFNVY